MAFIALLLAAGCGGSKMSSTQAVINELKQSETPSKAQEREVRELTAQVLPARYATHFDEVCSRFAPRLLRLVEDLGVGKASARQLAHSRQLRAQLLADLRGIAAPATMGHTVTRVIEALQRRLHAEVAFEEARGGGGGGALAVLEEALNVSRRTLRAAGLECR